MTKSVTVVVVTVTAVMFVATIAVAQDTCDGGVCIGGEYCCGGLICYLPQVQQCCLSGSSPSICEPGYTCDADGGGCVPGGPPTPAPGPGNYTCGSLNCTDGWLCCGNMFDGVCYPPNTEDVCCGNDTLGYTVCTVGEYCMNVTGQCVTKPTPAVPTCDPAPYSCCDYANGNTSYCCSSGANWTVCNDGLNCNATTGQCYTPTPAPTVPMCGGYECLAPNFCCGTRCYDPAYSYCCNAGAKWVVCNNGQTCDASTGQCRSPATSAPSAAPTPVPTTGPQCGGRPCALPNLCCGAQCYNPEHSFCCTAGTAGWAVCNSGQTCNATTGQCQTPTPAPTPVPTSAPTLAPTAPPTPVPTQPPIPTRVPTPPPTLAPSAGPQCGGYPCAVPNGCCGNQTYGRCFNPTDTFCCASGMHWALCNLGQTCNTITARCESGL